MSEGPEAPDGLVRRYGPGDLRVLSPDERERFLTPLGPDADAALAGDAEAWGRIAPHLAWELLYRIEPELYDRLVAGERIHPGVLDRLPADLARCVEAGAGTGRFTLEIVDRCEHLVAVEPAAPMRRILERRLDGLDGVETRVGFFDALPVDDDWADTLVSCSSFTPDEAHGGDAGLAELERVVRPGGLLALVWPAGVEWLTERGFTYERFPGEMAVRFPSLHEALELSAIFYPDAVEEIRERGEACVPYEVLGINPPRDLAWKRPG